MSSINIRFAEEDDCPKLMVYISIFIFYIFHSKRRLIVINEEGCTNCSFLNELV